MQHDNENAKGKTDMEQHRKQKTPQKQNYYKRYQKKYKVVSRQFVGSYNIHSLYFMGYDVKVNYIAIIKTIFPYFSLNVKKSKM